jgi:predicted secreted protein
MANELDGSGIYLIISDLIFANERGVTNSESGDSLETTNKHSTSKRKTFIGGETTGTITANGLYCVTDPSGTIGYESLKATYLARTPVTYEVGYVASGGKIESGSAIITALNMTANENEPASWDISLQKTGVWSIDDYSS